MTVRDEWEKCLDEGFALEASMKDAHKSGANQASKGLMRETPNPLIQLKPMRVYIYVYMYIDKLKV